ncbi:MAG: helix-turn-helix domain-containing protein [Alphaproteobacteria bacterium]|nr:helix-turn-helix domain-containing protein [Alphaproteobacteria bacterium]MBV8549351.1 helix-turn-helix domain-containing protein [Alphaproteobacteria bacterium]
MSNELIDNDNVAILIDDHVSNRIKLRRNMLGITQGQLAKFLGLTFQQVQKYENASNRIGAGRLKMVADFLQVPVSWFYEGLEGAAPAFVGIAEGKQAALEDAPPGGVARPASQKASALDVDVLAKPETMDLIRAYYAVKDRDQRRKIVDLIKSMADSDAV